LLHGRYLPNAVVILHEGSQIEKLVPFVKEQTAIENKTTAYVCSDYVCRQPITEVAEFEKAIS